MTLLDILLIIFVTAFFVIGFVFLHKFTRAKNLVSLKRGFIVFGVGGMVILILAYLRKVLK